MAECSASVSSATEPVTAPAIALSRMSAELEATDSAAAPVLDGSLLIGSRARPRAGGSRSARAARPRWLMASFSAGVSSAIVRPSSRSSGTKIGS